MENCGAMEKIPGKENPLYAKSILKSWELSDDDIKAVASGACALKSFREKNISPKIFDSGIAVSMFSKKDSGMEMAFASGCDLLGLTIIDMDKKLGNSAIKEDATMASYMADALGVCESDFIEKSSRYIKRISDAVEENSKRNPALLTLEVMKTALFRPLRICSIWQKNSVVWKTLKAKKLPLHGHIPQTEPVRWRFRRV